MDCDANKVRIEANVLRLNDHAARLDDLEEDTATLKTQVGLLDNDVRGVNGLINNMRELNRALKSLRISLYALIAVLIGDGIIGIDTLAKILKGFF